MILVDSSFKHFSTWWGKAQPKSVQRKFDSNIFHSLHIENIYYAIHYFLFGDGTNFKLLRCLWFLENFKECVKWTRFKRGLPMLFFSDAQKGKVFAQNVYHKLFKRIKTIRYPIRDLKCQAYLLLHNAL